MKIAGYDYMSGYSGMQNFDTESDQTTLNNASSANQVQTGRVVEVKVDSPDKTEGGSSSDTAGGQQGFVSLMLSAEGMRAVKSSGDQLKTSAQIPTNNFGTDDKTENTGASGNGVLNQYRFFVPNTNYSGEDGVVKRVFR